MGLKIYWSQLAEFKLKDIFSYYKLKAGERIAHKIVNNIIEKTDLLVHQPRIGAIEPLLIEIPQAFRYLISSNYKIIYYIHPEKHRIVIANVIDTRQNPVEIQETK